MSPNRIGRFSVSDRLLRDWRDLAVLFSQLIVIQTIHHWDREATEFLAYDFEFARGLDGSVDVKCIKGKAAPL